MSDAIWYVYLLLCRSGRIYTGVSPDPSRRLSAHLNGRGALFTKLDPPDRLLAVKPFASKRAALIVERRVKAVPPALKLTLAAQWLQEHPVDEVAQ
jgi:putative endonuclease